MDKQPLSVLIIGYLFIAAGVIGLAYHAAEFNLDKPFEYDLVLSTFVRLIAILGGVFMLRGTNWARWLLVAWMVYHVVLSIFHPLAQLLFHVLLLAVITYFLFRPKGSVYFKSAA